MGADGTPGPSTVTVELGAISTAATGFNDFESVSRSAAFGIGKHRGAAISARSVARRGTDLGREGEPLNQ
jgi:hypothetical protein